MNNPYASCQLHENGIISTKCACGAYLSNADKDMHVLGTLTRDLSEMIDSPTPFLEVNLINSRANYLLKTELDSNLPICPAHRFYLGELWRVPKQCLYVNHPTKSKAKGRPISWNLFLEIRLKDKHFPVKGLLCPKCSVDLKSTESCQEDEEDSEHKDPSFSLPEPSLMNEEHVLECRDKLNQLAELLGIDKCRNQVQSPVENLSERTLWYFRNYMSTLTDKVKEVCYECAAPGQKECFKSKMNDESAVQESIPTDIKHLVEAYNNCTTSEAKTAILTTVSKKYKKLEVIRHFKCSEARIRLARHQLKLYGPCSKPPNEKSKHNSRVSKENINHFLFFLFNSGLLKEEAYGVTKIKFDNGDKVEVSNSMLEILESHAIRQYKIYCGEVNYTCLGTTTLHLILKSIKPKHRKRVAGVDSFVVEGIESFIVSLSVKNYQ